MRPRAPDGDRPAHPPEKHWLFRGAQSALFYFLSCGPCHVAAHESRRKKHARRARCERQQEQQADPDRYHHPPPFDINPYWHEEMIMGPGPPPRRARRRGANGIASAGARAATTASTLASDETAEVARPESAHLGRPGWNLRRYERADEQLRGVDDATDTEADDWGGALDGPDDAGENASRLGPVRQRDAMGSSVGVGGIPPASPARPTTSSNRRPARSHSFYTTSTPSIPEPLQPVVSAGLAEYANRSANSLRWLTEPPPSAAFMDGKDPSNRGGRSRSGSEAGSWRRGSRTDGGRASSFSNRSALTPTRDGARRPFHERIARSNTAPETVVTIPHGSETSVTHGMRDRFPSITKTRSAIAIGTKALSASSSSSRCAARRAKGKEAPRKISGSSTTLSTDSLSSLDAIVQLGSQTGGSTPRPRSRRRADPVPSLLLRDDLPAALGGFVFPAPQSVRPTPSRKQLSTIISGDEALPTIHGLSTSGNPNDPHPGAGDETRTDKDKRCRVSRKRRPDAACRKSKQNCNFNGAPTNRSGYDGAYDQSIREWDEVMALEHHHGDDADAEDESDAADAGTALGARVVGMHRTDADGRWRWSTGF